MTDTSDALAVTVRDAWQHQHDDYYHCPCDGEQADCPAPKPASLVDYEQSHE